MNIREMHAALQVEIDAGRGEEPVLLDRTTHGTDVVCAGDARWVVGGGVLGRVGV